MPISKHRCRTCVEFRRRPEGAKWHDCVAPIPDSAMDLERGLVSEDEGQDCDCWKPLPDATAPSALQQKSENAALAAIRSAGYSVAIHNDYRQGGVPNTFWLFTHPDGTWVKGEGETDADALNLVLQQLNLEPPPQGA